MKLGAILIARAIGYFEVLDLDPRGRLYYPTLVEALIKRYEFAKFPKAADDFDESKGIEFHDGRWEDIAIDKMIIYSTGILIDTRSSTSDSRKLLESALVW